MEKIIETILERDIIVYTEDPLSLVFDMINSLSKLGEYDEKKNVYETDGPVKRINVIFSIVDKLDKNSKIDIRFDMTGQMGTSSFLEMKVEGNLVIKFDAPDGVVSETYMAYYLSNVAREFKNIAKDRMKDAEEAIADSIREFKHVYL